MSPTYASSDAGQGLEYSTRVTSVRGLSSCKADQIAFVIPIECWKLVRLVFLRFNLKYFYNEVKRVPHLFIFREKTQDIPSTIMILGPGVKFFLDFILRTPRYFLTGICFEDELKTYIPLFLEVQDVAGYVPHLYLALLVSNFISSHSVKLSETRHMASNVNANLYLRNFQFIFI